MEAFLAEFRNISSSTDLKTLWEKYGLKFRPDDNPHSQILGHYEGTVDGKQVALAHRWYDRSQVFSIQPDGNAVKLTIAGVLAGEVKFEDDN